MTMMSIGPYGQQPLVLTPDESREFPESLAAELVKLVTSEMTSAHPKRFQRAAAMCEHVHELVRMFKTGAKPGADDFDLPNQGPYPVGFGPTFSQETFGAKAMRELTSTIPDILNAQRDTPVALVRAIAEAKAAGLTDIADELTEKLTGRPPKSLNMPSMDLSKLPGTFGYGPPLADGPPQIAVRLPADEPDVPLSTTTPEDFVASLPVASLSSE